MLELIGWIGAICFALCAVPQAWLSIKNGHSHGVAWGFLTLWMVGEICTIIYVLPKQHWPLLFNYVFNIIFVAIIIYYKLRPTASN